MRTGIIRFPGSNCDYDALHYFEDSFIIWHKETEYPEDMDFLVIPGGFAFGDRIYDTATGEYEISPGTKCLESPVIEIIKEAANRKVPILGICNGFQILTKMGLLQGELQLNENSRFTCKMVDCFIEYSELPKIDIKLSIANSYGKYFVERSELADMEENGQIFLRYSDEIPEVMSLSNIAGVSNKSRTIFGMMPHPERSTSSTFKHILESMMFRKEMIKYSIRERITELMESEHISYKSTRKYLKQLHTKEKWVIQGPGENAGIIDIGNGYALAARIESHNHPTFIDPFEGAATGVGGILRDIFTMGARPIAILDFLRFGVDKHSNELLQNAMKGISYYGNCFGVANVGGDCYVHKSYNKNPLVNVGCFGIVKKKNIIYGAGTYETQCLIYVGSKTGYEGVGGAAMASQNFQNDQDLDKMKESVQKSDPFLEKLLLEACLEISEKQLAVGMQDMGAGGLLCATYEVISRGREKTKQDLGCNVFLERVPTKYNMNPTDILTSESQERMLIVANKEDEEQIFGIFAKWDLEYSTIGEITSDGLYSVYYNDLLYTENFTVRKDIQKEWKLKNCSQVPTAHTLKNNSTLRLQYDSTIGNRTVVVKSHYSILRIPEANKNLVLAWGESITKCHYTMIDLKTKPLAVINCLNYGDPEQKLSELVRDLDKLNTYCKREKVPIIGGNVSLYNCTDNVSIRPTPVFVLIGTYDC